jgi:hypothetical protein
MNKNQLFLKKCTNKMSSIDEQIFRILKVERFKSLKTPNSISLWLAGINFCHAVAICQGFVLLKLMDSFFWELAIYIGFFLFTTILLNFLLLRFHPIKLFPYTGCLCWLIGFFLLVYPIYTRL